MLAFAHQQLDCASPKTRKLAKDFIKKWETLRIMMRIVVIGLLAALLIGCAAATPTPDRSVASPTIAAASETKPELIQWVPSHHEMGMIPSHHKRGTILSHQKMGIIS